MHKCKAILSLAAGLLLSSGCLLADFDELQEQTWVRSDGKGDVGQGGFASGLAAIGDNDDIRYFVLTTADPTAIRVSIDSSNTREAASPFPVGVDDRELTAPGGRSVAATDTARHIGWDSEQAGYIAMGAFDDVAKQAALVMLQGTTSDNNFVSKILLGTGTEEPMGIAFGAGTTGTNLYATVGSELVVITDYENQATPLQCSLPAGGGAIVTGEFGVAGDRGVAVGLPGSGQVIVGDAAQVMPPAPCFGPNPTLLSAPGGESSFGAQMILGDFNGGGVKNDLVVAAPEQSAVYVYMDYTIGSGVTPTKLPVPGGAQNFGVSLTAGNYDNVGNDDLVVGDDRITIGEHPNAGKAFVFRINSAGDAFERVQVLHDARAEDNQRFGRSLLTVNAGGIDKLIVGANDEVFTYLADPVSGDQDFTE